MENAQEKSFQYTYSAREQAMIREIRSRYVPKEVSKIEQLQRMDAAVTQKAVMYSLVVGMIGALILGIGMCCCMVWGGVWFVPGIVIGLVGLGLTGAACPMYQRVLKKERERIAPEVLRLSGELMK